MAPLGNTDSTEFLQGRYYLYILNACTCLQNDSRAHHWRLLQSKALLWILAKIRVWLGYCQRAAGGERISGKGKDSQNESTCRRSYLLSWWNLPAFGRPEYTTQRFVEKSRVGQDKTKQNKQNTTNNTNASRDETFCDASVWEIAHSLEKPWKRKWFPFKFSNSEEVTASCRLALGWSDFSSTLSSKAKFSSYVTVEGLLRQEPIWQVELYKRTFSSSTLPLTLQATGG